MSSHRPRKRFGQHFLLDATVIEHIVGALQLKADQHYVEIGPGQGALTIPVLQKIKTLDVIELDRDVIPVLKVRTSGLGELNIHVGDVLSFDFASLSKQGKPLHVFGNLPYNISTPLLFHLFSYTNLIVDMIFMLQKEVAARMAAPCDESDYGRLSVMTQYHCEVIELFDVPPNAFFPPPKVDSSVVRLVPHMTLPYKADNYLHFAEVVKLAFSQRRKTLRNSLKTMISDAMWERLPIDPAKRAEQLTVKEFVELSNLLG